MKKKKSILNKWWIWVILALTMLFIGIGGYLNYINFFTNNPLLINSQENFQFKTSMKQGEVVTEIDKKCNDAYINYNCIGNGYKIGRDDGVNDIIVTINCLCNKE